MVTQKEIQDCMARMIADAMYMDLQELNEDELFSNFGLESLTLVKLVARINELYGVRIAARAIVKYQTLRAASQFIYQEIVTQQEVQHASP